MIAKALVQRPANTIQPLKAKKSSGTLLDEEVNRLVNIVADREPEVKAIRVNDKDGNMQANYCSILAQRQAQVQPYKRGETSTDVMPGALVKALNYTLPKD